MNVRFLNLMLSLIFGAIIFCIVTVEVPRIVKVAGYIDGDRTISKISPQFPGVLEDLLVVDRGRVIRGDVLGLVNSERFMSGRSLDEDQARITERKLSLDAQELKNIDVSERTAATEIHLKINSDDTQLEHIKKEQLMSFQRQVDLERQLSRQQSLVEQGFVSSEAVEQKRYELLAQKIAVSTLERSQKQLDADIFSQQQELILNATRAQTQRSLIQREIETLQQERNEHRAKRIQLVSPINGVVTQLSATVGQTVRPDVPVMTIVPTPLCQTSCRL